MTTQVRCAIVRACNPRRLRMKRRMTREEVLRDFGEAKVQRHIHPHFQPQYNHVTGRIIGAEALMR